MGGADVAYGSTAGGNGAAVGSAGVPYGCGDHVDCAGTGWPQALQWPGGDTAVEPQRGQFMNTPGVVSGGRSRSNGAVGSPTGSGAVGDLTSRTGSGKLASHLGRNPTAVGPARDSGLGRLHRRTQLRPGGETAVAQGLGDQRDQLVVGERLRQIA